jgi:nucleoside phosphorylase
VLVPARAFAIDGAERAGKAAFPQAMPVVSDLDVAICDALAAGATAVERGALATTLGITTDDALARELASRSGCYGENLEALAVALACKAAAVPFAAVLACTNEVGAQGRAQWLEHRAAAAAAVAQVVLGWLAGGATGLPQRRSEVAAS